MYFVTALAVILSVASSAALAQVCRISTSGLNRNRRVAGPVHAECPVTVHTVPFGNWGVTSNFGQKLDGNQFQGWCHDTPICDNRGNCRTECRDGWYEWNSCTDVDQFRAPNCTLYNDKDCTAQVSTTGQNVHGTRTVDLTVRCPTSSGAPGSPSDQGGCADIKQFDSGANFMSLYELDPGSTDDLIQTMYFPVTSLPLTCDVFGCRPAQSNWVAPIAYDSPSSPPRMSAEFSMTVNSAVFIDTSAACRAVGPVLSTVPAASFRRLPVAPESIASVFGSGLATATLRAPFLPLPTELSGTRVAITDSAGVSRPAPLFYVSPDQINILVPPGTATGTAQVVITRSDSVTSRGVIQIGTVSPDLFAANANGQGAAAATALRIDAAGISSAVPVFGCDTITSICQPTPISLQHGDVFLSLYATGLRSATNVTATIGGITAQVLFAGAQGQFVGLDQVNLLIPRSLAGRGTVPVTVQAGGLTSNAVTIAIQ